MNDVRDILDLELPSTSGITKESILGTSDSVKRKPVPAKTAKRPKGISREVFALLKDDDAPPVLPTKSGQGYKQTKAKLGMQKAHPWTWRPFTHPGRTDGAEFHSWQRTADGKRPYPIKIFHEKESVTSYTDSEYAQYLHCDTWNQSETNHLFDLCTRFNLRFAMINDRWNRASFPDRSVEDLKKRYYNVCSILAQVRAAKGKKTKIYRFDADRERLRKEQLIGLLERTPEQVEEENELLRELHKIQTRKKREKKAQDMPNVVDVAENKTEHISLENV